MRVDLSSRYIPLVLVSLVVWGSTQEGRSQENPGSKKETAIPQVPRDLKEWQIVLSIGGGTPGDASHSEVELKSDGKLIVEGGRGRKQRPRTSRTSTAELSQDDLRKAMELAVAAIERKDGWRMGPFEDGIDVRLTVKSGERSWSRNTTQLSSARDPAPELSQLIDLLDKQLKTGQRVLDGFPDNKSQ